MSNLIVVNRVSQLRNFRTQSPVAILELTALYPTRIPLTAIQPSFYKTH